MRIATLLVAALLLVGTGDNSAWAKEPHFVTSDFEPCYQKMLDVVAMVVEIMPAGLLPETDEGSGEAAVPKSPYLKRVETPAGSMIIWPAKMRDQWAEDTTRITTRGLDCVLELVPRDDIQVPPRPTKKPTEGVLFPPPLPTKKPD